MADDYEVGEDILDRLDADYDFDTLDLESYSTVKNRLNEIFDLSGHKAATHNQIRSVLGAGQRSRFDFPAAGITPVEFIRGSRPVVRYTIPGRRGLFNFASALDAYNNLKP